jgi:hypothetical protein
MKAPLSAAVAIGIGVIILLGYFIPPLAGIQTLLIGWAVILAGVAAIVGIINMIGVHLRKFTNRKSRDWFSLILILAFLITVGFGLAIGPNNPVFQQAVLSIQVPVEASLLAMLAITLAYAALRLLQRRKDTFSIIFVISVLVFLILGSGLLAFGGQIPLMSEITSILNWFPTAGARGILLGIALGSLVTGIRILTGMDRPYSG